MSPRRRHLGMTPRRRHLAMSPRRRHLGMRHLAMSPRRRHLGMTPRRRHLAMSPRRRHLAMSPAEETPGPCPRGGDTWTMTPRRRHRHVPAEETPGHVPAEETPGHDPAEETPGPCPRGGDTWACPRGGDTWACPPRRRHLAMSPRRRHLGMSPAEETPGHVSTENTRSILDTVQTIVASGAAQLLEGEAAAEINMSWTTHVKRSRGALPMPEYKRARQEIKKKSSDTLKLQKKAKKGKRNLSHRPRLLLVDETEKQAVRKALIEERQRLCCFVAMLRPLVDEEMAMLGEVTHLQTISDDLKALTSDPHKLPPASEQVIMDLKDSALFPASATMSRKSSMCSSSLNSVNSSDSRGSSSGSHSHSPSSSSSSSSTSSSHNLLHNNHHNNNNNHHRHHHHRYRSSTLPLQAPPRLSSISSHDSGFTSSSHEQNAPSQSPSPMPADAKDWAKPGPYDQPMVNTLRRRKDKEHPPTSLDCYGCANGDGRTPAPRAHLCPTPLGAGGGHGASLPLDMAEELGCRPLGSGPQLDTQSSSRDSIQCSSGYSTQSTTPCCSEDTIPSQGARRPGAGVQQQSLFDKSSTIPRNSEISQSYRRMFQAKEAGLDRRPAQRARVPRGPYPPTPPRPRARPPHAGTATIRRTPSTKPAVRRSGSAPATGPIPIRTPVVPAQIPTVPDLPAARLHADRSGGEQAVSGPRGPDGPLSPGREGLSRAFAQTSAHAPPTYASLGFLPSQRPGATQEEWGGEEEVEVEQGGSMLAAIRKGVRLKRTLTNDRSAPRIA
ncbi:hypothetical protein CRUP_010583 [Coryphaenoides rupestris]|nr:hypothetical protein CRUP_010583 [Coryphaenoides rupestris]